MTLNKDLAERIAATFLQSAIATLGTNSVMDLGVDQWKMVVASGVAAVLSLAKGWAAARVGTPGTASLAD